MRRAILSFAVVLAVAMAVGPIPGVTANRATPGARESATLLPEPRERRYDVQHYDLAIRYKPGTDYLWGVATIDAVATQGLSSFNLDLVGLTVRSITVDGAAATWSRTEHELTVVPAAPIDDRSRFTAQVSYDGVPVEFFLPLFGFQLQMGFMHTSDGAIVAGAPHVAAFWYPANDHPVDRATYTFDVTVPDKYGVVANGLPTGTEPHGDWTTHVWQATVYGGVPGHDRHRGLGHQRLRHRAWPTGDRAVDPQHHQAAQAILTREEEILAFLEDAFRTYPFESAGAIVDDHPGYQFTMEMQTRPVYPTAYFKWGSKNDPAWITSLVLHELAHMWFGDLVAVNQWKDIWLNEGPTSYAGGSGPSTRVRRPLRRSSRAPGPASRRTDPSGRSSSAIRARRTCSTVPCTCEAR
jgi:hypothetical protein